MITAKERSFHHYTSTPILIITYTVNIASIHIYNYANPFREINSIPHYCLIITKFKRGAEDKLSIVWNNSNALKDTLIFMKGNKIRPGYITELINH